MAKGELPSANLRNRRNQLQKTWQNVCEEWADDARKNFQRSHWEPIQESLRKLQKQLEELEKDVDKAVSHCPEPGRPPPS